MARSPCRLAAALIGVFLLLPLPARAVEIVVDSVTYDIVFFTGSENIPANLALLQNQPWFTGSSDPADRVPAQTFAQAYLAQAGTAAFDLTGSTDLLHFVYNDTATNVAAAVVADLGLYFASGSSGFLASSSSHFAYVAGTPAAVPEIDGNALAKALFVLLAFGLWLRGRRTHA